MSIGVNIIGLFKLQCGLSEMARRVVKMMEYAQIPYVCGDLGIMHPPYHGELPEMSEVFPYPITIICTVWLHTDLVLSRFGNSIFDKYTIGIWCWETDKFPHVEQRVISLYDEIWTISEYCKEIIQRHIDLPINVIQFPIIPEVTGKYPLPNKFVFLFVFSYGSTIERKNPLYTIGIFREAFGDRDDVLLVLKSTCHDILPNQGEKLLKAIEGCNNILYITDNLSNEERWNILNTCNVYISLHSSEGLGFTGLEAMSLGKPVIATGFSGNMEYMNDSNSIPIPYSMVPVPPECTWYNSEGTWALADRQASINALTRVVSDEIYTRSIGDNAKQYISYHWSLESCTEKMKRIIFNSIIRYSNRDKFSAFYGIPGNYRDVTHIVSNMIVSNRICIPSIPYNDIFGDHIPYKEKHLIIRHNKLSNELILTENTPIDYPLNG